jgi:hypothetical protein
MSLDKLFTLVWKRIYQDDIAYREINIEREKQYLFTKGVGSKPVCNICNACAAVAKKLNIERYFNQCILVL